MFPIVWAKSDVLNSLKRTRVVPRSNCRSHTLQCLADDVWVKTCESSMLWLACNSLKIGARDPTLMALICQSGMSAFLTLSGEERTSREHRQNVDNDPKR